MPVDLTGRQIFSVYPNPSKGAIYITGMDGSTTSVTAQWFDLSGKLLSQATVPVQGGAANLNVNLTQWNVSVKANVSGWKCYGAEYYYSKVK